MEQNTLQDYVIAQLASVLYDWTRITVDERGGLFVSTPVAHIRVAPGSGFAERAPNWLFGGSTRRYDRLPACTLDHAPGRLILTNQEDDFVITFSCSGLALRNLLLDILPSAEAVVTPFV